MRKLWSDQAWEDHLLWQARDRKTLARINRLIKELERADGTGTIGKTERLRHSKRGLCSVRIDQANRLVYKLEDGVLYIVSCRGHYT